MVINALLLVIYFLPQTSWISIDVNSFKKEMKLAEKYFEEENYSFDYEYTSYVGRESATVHDRMKGYFVKNGLEQFSSFEDQLTFQNSRYKVLVDKATKEIIVTKSQENEVSELDVLTYEYTLESASKISKKTSSGVTQYRLDYTSGNEYSNQILEFDSSYLLKRIITNYAEKQEVENNSGKKVLDYPRMELSIHNYNKKMELLSNQKVSSVINTEGKSIQLRSEYKNYQLTDLSK